MPSGFPIPDEVYEDIIELLTDLIARYSRKRELKAAVRECLKGSIHAEISHVTIEKMITEARIRVRAACGLDRDEARANSIAFYISVIQDPRATIKEKVDAQTRLDKVFGNEHIYGVGTDAETTARRIREEIKKQEQSYGGDDSSNPEDEGPGATAPLGNAGEPGPHRLA